MPTGDTLLSFEPTGHFPPTTNYATLSTRNTHPILQFDAATAESAYFSGVLPRFYTGLGITVRICWAATSAVASTCTWQAAFERHDTGTDLDADSFATAVAASAATTSGTAGAPTYTDIAFSNSQIDGLAAGEHFRLKITRNTGGLTGDAELIGVELRET